MPAANHSFYLRNCYLENKLTKGEMEIGGERLDLSKVTIPIYNLATREDHIAPALSVFKGAKFFGGPVRYVLAGSGHIAGVVNPPGQGEIPVLGRARRPAAPSKTGSRQRRAARAPGGRTGSPGSRRRRPRRCRRASRAAASWPPLGDAPGEYVRVKS